MLILYRVNQPDKEHLIVVIISLTGFTHFTGELVSSSKKFLSTQSNYPRYLCSIINNFYYANSFFKTFYIFTMKMIGKRMGAWPLHRVVTLLNTCYYPNCDCEALVHPPRTMKPHRRWQSGRAALPLNFYVFALISAFLILHDHVSCHRVQLLSFRPERLTNTPFFNEESDQ